MALKPDNPVVGGTVLRRAAIRSPNFVTGVSGWTINQDGSAEFNNLTIRGTFAGTDFIINSSGSFFYSPSEAAGNLVESSAPAAGTEQFGNHYVAGHATYAANFATSVNAGFVQFYSGSLAGGWSVLGSIQTDVLGDIILLASAGRSVITNNNTLDDGSGNMTVAGTLTVGGSNQTGQPVGTGFFNTQGLASGSYGSTHQHTLPNFPTATHTHPL
jgi:hypothetical protein